MDSLIEKYIDSLQIRMKMDSLQMGTYTDSLQIGYDIMKNKFDQ